MHISGFDIGREIGGGDELRLYRARGPGDGPCVLLRVAGQSAGLEAPGRARLERELKICRELEIDGVPAALDLVEEGESLALMLAETPGVTLDRFLESRGAPLPLKTALSIGARLAGTLSALHRKGLVHRDLRPANILYDEDSGQVHLTGLGRASRVPREAWGIRPPDRLEGDPRYLAPEATGRLNRRLDSRADLYSLGAILFEMLSGRPPFIDADPAALVHAHIALQPQNLSELLPTSASSRGCPVPAAVSAIVSKLLAKAAEERYQSGVGLRHDLERCLKLQNGEGTLIKNDGLAFELGERDLPERFELPQKLFGRSAELRWLQESLEEVGTGGTAMRLVAGYSGVGKTALIEELRFSALQQQALFASGTFDPRSSATPYEGILSALRDLVNQELGAKPEEVRGWGQRLEEELGANLRVVTEVLPELASLVGEPPSAPRVEPESVRNRFFDCVGRFLATLTRAESPAGSGKSGRVPFVLFLDDLQWIDRASLELLSSLLTGERGSFLVLGAYRDNLVSKEHLLARGLAELSSRGVDLDTLRLAPLAEPDLRQLISETLQLAPSQVAPLAELVYRKTAGNPFFARTFLMTLYRRRLLRFNAAPSEADEGSEERIHWSWDLTQITSLDAMENVIELVASRLIELPPDTRGTLAVASVLGKEVDAETLAAVSIRERSTSRREGIARVEGILIEACREGLMTKLDMASWEEPGGEQRRYAFVHDRVREGALELLQDEELSATHLHIGRLLRDRGVLGDSYRTGKNSRRDGVSSRGLFEIVDHLNRASHLITDLAERRQLVRLNAEAGRQARASGAFRAAYTYLKRAVEHLDWENDSSHDSLRRAAGPWQEDYELTRSLFSEAAELASLAGDFDAAEQLADALSHNAQGLLDAVPAYETRIYVLHARRELEAAVCLSLDILGRFEVELPLHPDAADLEAAKAVATRSIESVLAVVKEGGVQELPVMTDPTHLVVSRLLERTAMMSAWTRMGLLRLAVCRLVELTAAHGLGEVSPMAYVLMGEVYCSELEDVEGGRRVGELGLTLARHLGSRGREAACRMGFELLIGGRIVHPTTHRQRFAEHHRRLTGYGDFHLAAASGLQTTFAGLLSGTELAAIEASAREYHAKVHGLGQMMIAHALGAVRRLVGVLLGQGTVEQAIDTPDDTLGAEANIRTRVIGPELMVRFLLGQKHAAFQTARESLAMQKGIVPLFPFDFYRCLIFLEAAADGQFNGDDLNEPSARLWRELGACQARLERRAQTAPEIYQHKLELVEAMALRVAGRPTEALERCEQAASGARESQLPHEEAMARELAAKLCLELGREGAAATHLRSAVVTYRQWGARAKVEQLFETYPDLVAASQDLDLTTLERAQSALSGELDLEKLLRRLMTLLLQNAGARRGFLIRGDTDGRMIVEARGTTHSLDSGVISRSDLAESETGGDEDISLPEDLELDACDEIAATVVRFVARTQETVTLGEATRDPRFATDAYIAGQRPYSILCFPVLHRGQAVEIIYLENDRSPDAFSPDRQTAVRLLGSQAAAALENARLHLSLKRAEAELRKALEEVAELKDRLEAENVYLQEEIQSHFEEIVGDSPAIRKVLYKVEQVAATDATVLILGETGTGKELFARALHRLSTRRERPLVKVNCAALPATLIESELFGHEKGAFTGALSRKVGRFELADSGTLFLDEIGDLPLDLQAKLLRVLQEGELEKLGSTTTQKVDVRIIAATNRDLERAMEEGNFRSDLYYRLTVFPIELPPLRERGDDVSLLARYFVDRKRAKLGSRVSKISVDAMSRLTAYPWPGNVRELENVVERALILSPDETLELDESFGVGHVAPGSPEHLAELEGARIRGVLEACDWRIKGSGNAAERLGYKPSTLRDRIKKLGIVRR